MFCWLRRNQVRFFAQDPVGFCMFSCHCFHRCCFFLSKSCMLLWPAKICLAVFAACVLRPVFCACSPRLCRVVSWGFGFLQAGGSLFSSQSLPFCFCFVWLLARPLFLLPRPHASTKGSYWPFRSRQLHKRCRQCNRFIAWPGWRWAVDIFIYMSCWFIRFTRGMPQGFVTHFLFCLRFALAFWVGRVSGMCFGYGRLLSVFLSSFSSC